jgi:hypothetical protein
MCCSLRERYYLQVALAPTEASILAILKGGKILRSAGNSS